MAKHRERKAFNVLDRVLGWFSPRAGLRRIRDRHLLELIQTRNYSAADRGRRTDGWNLKLGRGPNTELARSLPLMRERVRDLVRNNPWAASMRSEIVANLIHHGIIASFSTAGSGDKAEEKGHKYGDVPAAWLGWADTPQCDAARRKDIYDIQKLVAGTWFETGECFVRRVWRDDWRPGEIPFALQVLEPEFIDHSHDGQDNTKLGIKFSDTGVALGYWVFRRHPSETIQDHSFFVPAEDMIHVFSEDRPGQIRGIPIMAPAVLRVYDLDLFEQAALQKQEIAAMFAGFLKRTEMYAPSTDELKKIEDGQMVDIDHIEPGTMQRLGPYDDVVFSNPPQRSGYTDYVRQNLMGVAAGVGLTYESMSGDYGRMTFLNGRMGQLRFHRKIDQWQHLMIIPQFCNRVSQWFFEGAELAGIPLGDLEMEWRPPVKQMVDPKVEAEAEEKLVRMGAKTHFEMIQGYGNDPVRMYRQRKKELEMADEMGLVFTTDARQVSGAGQLQPGHSSASPDTKEDAPEEDSEEKK